MFFQGPLMPDPLKTFINAQEGRTTALRQWRFSDEAIDPDVVASYLEAAIEVQEGGRLILPDRSRPVEIPLALGLALAEDSDAEEAFRNLTPGKRREYAAYVVDANRADTKTRRIGKMLTMIRAGLGLHYKYRST